MKIPKKEILTTVATLACAAGIGYFMQSSPAAQDRFGPRAPQQEQPQQELGDIGALLDVREVTLTSGELNADVVLPAPESAVIKASAPKSTLHAPQVFDAAVTSDCPIVASARPIAAAMVNLTLEATCMPNERITVHHNGMIFTETTDMNGSLDLRVPALAQEAVFILAFTNGDGAVAQTTVEELADYDRAVLQWKGDTGFQIHAREFGANYGDARHHWRDAPGELADAVTGKGGVLTRHGDADAAEPLLAEVYTFPRQGDRAGSVALSVETEVSDANCGLEIEAQSLQLTSDANVTTQDLILSVPDCDAVGSFLVLNNLLQDLKVAGR